MRADWPCAADTTAERAPRRASALSRAAGLTLAASLLAAAPAVAQDRLGLSSSSLSSCLRLAAQEHLAPGSEIRAVALDGMPTVTIDRFERNVGLQPVATAVDGTGRFHRGGDSAEAFHFLCLIDPAGAPVLFRAGGAVSPNVRGGYVLPVRGEVAYRERLALPQEAELRVQLLDVSKPGASSPIAGELAMRASHGVPWAFTLSADAEAVVDPQRSFALDARIVVGDRTLFRLAEPRRWSGDDLNRRIELVLQRAP